MAWSERAQFSVFLGLWSRSGVSSYAFDIIYYGAIPEAPPMRIVVRDGAVHSADLLCQPPLTEESCSAWLEMRMEEYGPGRLIKHAKTIPQLFDRMSIARAHPHDWNARIFTEFDPTYGFPERFSFDNPNGEDEEYGFEISNFTVSQ